MKSIRIILLLFIGIWIFAMAVLPAVDSNDTADAYRRYVQSRSAEALRDAKKSMSRDTREWLFEECAMGVVLVAAIYCFIRAGRTAQEASPNQSAHPPLASGQRG